MAIITRVFTNIDSAVRTAEIQFSNGRRAIRSVATLLNPLIPFHIISLRISKSQLPIFTFLTVISVLVPISAKTGCQHCQKGGFAVYQKNNLTYWEKVKCKRHLRRATDPEIRKNLCGPVCQCPHFAESCNYQTPVIVTNSEQDCHHLQSLIFTDCFQPTDKCNRPIKKIIHTIQLYDLTKVYVSQFDFVYKQQIPSFVVELEKSQEQMTTVPGSLGPPTEHVFVLHRIRRKRLSTVFAPPVMNINTTAICNASFICVTNGIMVDSHNKFCSEYSFIICIATRKCAHIQQIARKGGILPSAGLPTIRPGTTNDSLPSRKLTMGPDNHFALDNRYVV
uniref:Phlebovirus_G2 domain-containing protein n=1 Tax=Heterorhabditis bacteriophora TaxID=37862 RepID=A0A1I7WCE0_HETBA